MMVDALMHQMCLAAKAAAFQHSPARLVGGVARGPDPPRLQIAASPASEQIHCLGSESVSTRARLQEVAKLEAWYAPIESVKTGAATKVAGVVPDPEDEDFAGQPAPRHPPHIGLRIVDGAMAVDPGQPALEILPVRIDRGKQCFAIARPVRAQHDTIAAQLLGQVDELVMRNSGDLRLPAS